MDSIEKWVFAMRDVCPLASDLTEELVERGLEVVTGEDESRFFENWRALGFEVSLQELRAFLAGCYVRFDKRDARIAEQNALLPQIVGMDAFADGLAGSEWAKVAPVASDARGDVASPSLDVTAFYAVVHGEYLCVRMDCAGEFSPSEVRYCLYFRGSGLDGGVDFVADGLPRLTVVSSGKESEYYIPGGMGEVLEAVIPLDVLGRPSSLEIIAVVQPLDQSWAYDGIEATIDGL
jgi:hypothetical protein